MKNLKKYEAPTVDVISFDSDDVILTSNGFDGEVDPLSENEW